MDTKYIFAKPDYIEGIGNIHPIKLKDHDEFLECSSFLYFSKNHFAEDYRELPLLQLILFGLGKEIVEQLIVTMGKMFALTLCKKVNFFMIDKDTYGFVSEDQSCMINADNYEELRQLTMRQNLMFEQKVYKDKIVQNMMNKVFEQRAKNSIKMEFEDMISTVSVFTGKHYWDLSEYTIYQLKSDFDRISKFKKYDTGIAVSCVSSEPVNVEYFAERVDLFKNPYDLDNFTKEKDKLNKLNEATK
jgi:hypothetical protein